MALLSINSLSFNILDKYILNDINFSLDTGEIVCIVGKNGAGKTSLLKALTGIESKGISGVSIFENIDLHTSDRIIALKEIGVMLNTDTFYNYLTGIENLKIVERYYSDTYFSPNEILELFNLQNKAKEKVEKYSMGMKQRLALAMAFINRPKLLILDEPFNSIDKENVIEIINLIKKLNKEFQTSFIITSHSLPDIKQVYTRFCILKNGMLVFDRTKTECEKYKYMIISMETEVPIIENNYYGEILGKRVILTQNTQDFYCDSISQTNNREAVLEDFYEIIAQ